jgi:hypothetical protein
MHKLPILAQNTDALCWEACARMVWAWRHKNLTGYAAKAGSYTNVTTGLTQTQMDAFYKQLGLRALARPTAANLRRALTWSPVIFTSMNKVMGHAMVALGYTVNQYQIANPCGVQSVSFGEDDSAAASCSATTTQLAARQIERELGQYIWYW